MGQAAIALGLLVGIRLVTEAVPPGVYGTATLILGVVGLTLGLVAGPIMQAVLRFYPEYHSIQKVAFLRRASLRALRVRITIGLLAAMFAVSLWAWHLNHSLSLGPLCAALLLIEVLRAVEINFLNGARRQKAMSLLLAGDAWFRPIGAVGMVWLTGVHASAVLLGHIAGASIALALFYALTRGTSQTQPITGIVVDDGIEGRLKTYAIPLTPLPLLAWLSGQADRYILAALAGLQAAGVYAAMYGLASRPFLMLAGAFELALRQIYYGKVNADDRLGERKVFWGWLSAVVGASALLWTAFLFLHEEVATLLLASEYRAESKLMVWVAAGYVLAACSLVVERVCYALHDTRGVLFTQTTGAVLSIVVAVPMVYVLGIQGAAIAVPVYFGLQLAITAWRAASVQRRRTCPTNGKFAADSDIRAAE